MTRIERILKERLKYCREQNGRPDCKNCSLSRADLLALRMDIQDIERNRVLDVLLAFNLAGYPEKEALEEAERIVKSNPII